MNKKAIIGAVLVIAAMMMAPVMMANNAPANDIEKTYETIYAIHERHPVAAATNAANVLVSPGNPDGDDMNPKIAFGHGFTVATYEQHTSTFDVKAPIVYSDDGGASWTTFYEMDSGDSGSGILQSCR